MSPPKPLLWTSPSLKRGITGVNLRREFSPVFYEKYLKIIRLMFCALVFFASLYGKKNRRIKSLYGEQFFFRAYTKKELALMYFPSSMPRTAVSHLMAWIHRCGSLWQQLQTMGYSVTSKGFTPRQVRAIVEQLGEP